MEKLLVNDGERQGEYVSEAHLNTDKNYVMVFRNEPEKVYDGRVIYCGGCCGILSVYKVIAMINGKFKQAVLKEVIYLFDSYKEYNEWLSNKENLNNKHMSEKIINFDSEGWPEKAMSIRDILKSFGAEYNKDTNKWEIEDSEYLDVIPELLMDDSMGYGVDEEYLISGNFHKRDNGKERFSFFRDKELDYSNVWVEAGLYPGQDFEDEDGETWSAVEVVETEDGYEFCCHKYDPETGCSEGSRSFTMEQIKERIKQY